jgi:hypothetical protein
MILVLSALSPPPQPTRSMTTTSLSTSARISSVIGSLTSVSTSNLSTTTSSHPSTTSSTNAEEGPIINSHAASKSTVILIPICSTLAAVVLLFLVLIALGRFWRGRSTPGGQVPATGGSSLPHTGNQYSHEGFNSTRRRTPIRPNGQPRDLRSWINGMSDPNGSSEEATSPRQSIGAENFQKFSSFRIPRKPLPSQTWYTSSSIHTSASHYVTAPSTPPSNVITFVEPLEEQSLSAGSSITMSAPIASGVVFGGRGKDSPKHSSVSTVAHHSIDYNPRPNFHQRSTSTAKRFVTDPLPIPGARPITASTTTSSPYEGRTSSDFFHAAPPTVLSRDDTSPTPSSVCIRDLDVRNSEPEGRVMILGTQFAGSNEPSSQQTSSPGFRSQYPVFDQQHALRQMNGGFRQPFYGQHNYGVEGQRRAWPIRTFSDVSVPGVKMGNTATGLPLVYFPTAQDGVQSARGSVHSGNTHSHPHSLSHTNLHTYIHSDEPMPHSNPSGMDSNGQRQRTLSLPLARMKRAKSAEMLNERWEPESSPKSTSMEQKKGGARRPGVVRKEVPKHLLAQLEGLSAQSGMSAL